MIGQLFGAERPALAGVRVQAEHEDARARDAEPPLQVVVRDANQAVELRLARARWRRSAAARRRRQRDAQRFAGEQHARVAALP